MLTMENVTALRMRRHCLTRRAGAAEYDALYRDLSPGLNVHWHGFGQPPCLVERADFDDVEYNGRRQRQRILVKGRFQNGNIGFVEAAQMELFAGLYRRPYKPTEHSELLRELIGREGPLNIEAMKRMTGLLVKQITPALHRLQEAFLVFEDQFDGEWDRGWYLFDEMFPDVDPARISRTEALLRVLPRLAHRQVYLTAADAKDFYGLPARDVAAAMEELARQGILVRWREGYLPAQDVPLLQAQAFEPLSGVLALHRNDPLVRCGESARKERYKSPEKGSEVTQYLLVDGVIRGAVMGHFRYGPYDLHAVWLELPEQEAAVRRDEILRAVYAVNGPREEPPPFVPVG